ncbi:MAG: AAC(3) family N-acetyltransferase [Clostridia bacterium]|nr:AAC(3) family N-acetyltransferase [Clostridia bacterium]
MFTKNDIIRQLENMNAPRNSIVMVHTSMRTVGAVEGGAEGLLEAFLEYFTAEDGLLCVPVHTWRNFGKSDRITLDLTTSENSLGVFSTVAAADPRCVRSENPTHSVAVFGDRARAEAFVRDDAEIVTPTAPESCYGKLYSEGGHVLLVGVPQTQNTYLHCVGEILNLPNRMAREAMPVTVRRPSGEIVHRELRLYYTDYMSNISSRFMKYDTAFRYHGCITDGFIGNAPTQLCDAVKMKETVELVYQNAGGVDPLATERCFPPQWFCPK